MSICELLCNLKLGVFLFFVLFFFLFFVFFLWCLICKVSNCAVLLMINIEHWGNGVYNQGITVFILSISQTIFIQIKIKVEQSSRQLVGVNLWLRVFEKIYMNRHVFTHYPS